MAEGLRKGFFPAPQKKEKKPETSNSSPTMSSLIIQQFSQALQPPNLEKQRQSQIEQEIKSTETDQSKRDFLLPQPRSSNYMKSGNQKIMQKQKNDEQLIIEQLMKSIRNLQEEVQILKKENQKLLQKSQNNEERLMKQEIEVKLLGEKRIQPQTLAENKMELEYTKPLEITPPRRIVKLCYLCKSKFHTYKRCKIYFDKQRRNSEEIWRELSRIYVDKDGRIFRRRLFQGSARTPKKLGVPNFYFKPQGTNSGGMY